MVAFCKPEYPVCTDPCSSDKRVLVGLGRGPRGGIRRDVRRLALVLGLIASASRELAAQAVAEPERWRIAFPPYVWMPGLKGTIGVGSNVSEVDVSFSEGAGDFEFGFASLLEIRRNPWVLRTDFYYVS